MCPVSASRIGARVITLRPGRRAHCRNRRSPSRRGLLDVVHLGQAAAPSSPQKRNWTTSVIVVAISCRAPELGAVVEELGGKLDLSQRLAPASASGSIGWKSRSRPVRQSAARQPPASKVTRRGLASGRQVSQVVLPLIARVQADELASSAGGRLSPQSQPNGHRQSP
jgi:hypothetical protein